MILEFPIFLFTIAKIAPFLIASSAKLLPSYFFPFIPTNIEFLSICLEFIDTEFTKYFLLMLLSFNISFKIFVFIDLDKSLFFFKIAFKISNLSEKNFFFLYSW